MKKPSYRIIIILLGIFLSFRCSNSEREADKLCNQASRLLEKAEKTEKKSYSKALDIYKDTLTIVEKITSKYPSTRIAKDLVQEYERIGPYTVTELKEKVVPAIKMKADAEDNPLACALYVAESMEDAEERALAFAGIAGCYAEANRKDEASEFLTRALAAAKAMEECLEKNYLISYIAAAYVEYERYDEAFKIAGLMDDEFDKAGLLAGIAIKYAETGQPDKAFKLAETIEYYRDLAMAEIAGEYIAAGRHERALDIEKTVKLEDERARVLAAMAAAYEKAGQKKKASGLFSRALAAVEAMEESHEKITVLVEIAGRYLKADPGWKEKVEEILSRAVKIAGTIEADIASSTIRGDALAEIADAYAQAGYYDRAFEIAAAMNDPAAEDTFKYEALARIACRLSEAGEYDRAVETAMLLQDDHDRDKAMAGIASDYANNDKYDQALRIAGTLESPDFKNRVLVNIAGNVAARKNFHQAFVPCF